MRWCHREPTLEEILADPVTTAVMEADGVDPQELAAMLKWIVQARAHSTRAGPHSNAWGEP